MRWIAALTIAAVCSAQLPTAHAQSADAETVTVPAGTLVPLKLISEVHKLSTHPGDPVRAEVAFPISIGSHVAIPAGTYVEGTVLSTTAPGRDRKAELHLHFTSLVFPNGYSIPLDAVNEQTLVLEPELGRTRATYELADVRDGMPMLGEGEGQATTTPTVSMPGPNPAVVVGAALGGTAAVLVLALVLGRRHAAHTDFVLFASGWQFQMELARPLTVDLKRIAAPASAQ